MPEQHEWSAEDEEVLADAVELLERNTLSEVLLEFVGSKVTGGMKSISGVVPEKVRSGIAEALSTVLERAFNAVLLTVDRNGASLTSASWFGRISVAISGGVGGFFGLPGTSVELPVTTALLMRGIAQAAVREGEDLSAPEAKLECLKVFAFGGMQSDGTEDEGYYATRLALAGVIPKLTEKSLQEVVARAAGTVAERFVPAVMSKFGAQAAPGIGAAAGILVNSAFADHYERKAKGHFTVRRLERCYGVEAVKARYDMLKASSAARGPSGKLGASSQG